MFNYKGVEVEDTFAEMFPMWAGRVLITADSEKWALTAARNATGFASSIIMSPAEAGIEGLLPGEETPDGRPGALIQIYQRDRGSLKQQLIARIGQCVMTCPTTAAFDGLPKTRRRLKIGKALSIFGDGFQEKATLYDRKVWRIPVMEGEFIVEDSFGTMRAIAGGAFLIMAKDFKTGLEAAEAAVNAIGQRAKYVILPFPGGICRSGSKAGSMKYKLPASTNHPFCPTLKGSVTESRVPEGVNAIYEIVVNGLDQAAVKRGMGEGIRAAVEVPGVLRISAVNFGGRLGPYKAYLREVLELQ
ncbi:formylmethanofuran--tetrahydromethanopterin N-formyltransferase [Candidatus Bathyarchaeota archaeon]|nr:formylmethanofuran--tetrahydromethanopterin N-formyltransferase [Candidatus Bathyarchaeota archaeon]